MTRRLLLCAVLLLTACGDRPAPRPATGAQTVIVEVDRRDGLAAGAGQWALPTFTLYGDGTAVTRGEDRGALLTGRRRTLSAAQVDALFERAAEAGLFADRDHPRQATDPAVLTVRLTTTDGTYATTVRQPSPGETGDRGDTIAFADAAAAAGVDAGEYLPQRAAVLVVADVDDDSDVRPWPLGVPLSAMDGAPRRPCHVVDGAALAALRTGVGSAGGATRWQAGTQRVRLVVRPLLPHERTCADLD
ncbi:hypothetical protein GA0070606_0421 [Micromonospora citrea]|uniref:Lipoprotein n=1 Tax=Micromonospora citrea TaxID=47855 RepID=A0A1C6TSS2_9ACTN|nr:hypothetical protein [Micromonospora citrea]SCL44728.1 hypothetical protein GA0070606_0421 [Micromonospora citrea]